MSTPLPSHPTGAAAAFSDGLGERVRTTGADGQPLEVLMLRPDFTETPAFETALRERTARLAAFRDPAFASVVRIDRVPPEGGALAIVSERVEGLRLSRVLEDVVAGRRDVPFDTATRWLCEITSAMARLHAYGRNAAHGALAPERVVLTQDGQIVIVESVLGAGLEQLQWSRRRLWLEVRAAMPPSAGLLRFDQRADLAQIGVTALAILLGRPLRDADYPDELPLVLREASDRVAHANPTLATGFASWLVRMLQVEGRPFGSLKEALAALEELLSPIQRPALTVQGRLHEAELFPIAEPVLARSAPPIVASPARTAAPRLHAPWPEAVAPLSTRVPSPAAAAHRPIPAVESWPRAIRITLVLVAIGATTAAATVGYLTGRTATIAAGARAGASAQPPAVAPVLHVKAPAPPAARPAVPAGSAPVTAAMPAIAPLAAEAPPDLPQGGWLVIKAPVDVVVSIGGDQLGESRQGRFPLAAGVHDIGIVNDTLGLRQAHQIVIRPGEETVLTVQLPSGVVDLNAIPWAEVWLDGQRLGETPMGSLSVPVGPHEFVFRHPELGERRYTVTVTAAEPVRLSVDLSKQ